MPKFVARKPEKEVISLRISTDILKEIDVNDFLSCHRTALMNCH